MLLFQVLLRPDGFLLRYLRANVLERLHSLSLGTNIRQESESSESPKRASNFSMGLNFYFFFLHLNSFMHYWGSTTTIIFFAQDLLLLLFLFCFEFPSSSLSEVLHGIMM